ncbi:MAG TPA: hypothetical protein VKU80_08810 [Planctomycetota bacterium]|nr:hypothetical protein [Planctomycetota bacterium]
MSRRLIPVLFVLAAAAGCHRKTHHPPGSPGSSPTAPALTGKMKSIPFGGKTHAYQLTLEGFRCKSIVASLLHITADGVVDLAHQDFSSLPETFEGGLWLLSQDGEPFGKKGQTIYTLGDSMAAGLKSAASSGPKIFEGPYAAVLESFQSQGSFPAGRDSVVLARCLSKREHASFSSGDLEALKKYAADTKDEIVSLVLRWESQ